MKALFALSLFVLVSFRVNATFSVIACKAETGVCGAAVATNNLAVGASTIFARANLGALVSQFETHPNHAELGFELLTQQLHPAHILQTLLENNNNFDGGSIADRQVAIIDAQNRIATFSGANALNSGWAGQLQSTDATFQGNGLVSKKVLISMQAAWQNSEGSLASRLMESLEAGQIAGGQANGQMSAALLVRTPAGFPFDIDLRVDAHQQPIQQLRFLLDLHEARQLIIKANRIATKQPEFAYQLLTLALQKGQRWDRILKRGIAVAKVLGHYKLQARLEKQLQTLNPRMTF